MCKTIRKNMFSLMVEPNIMDTDFRTSEFDTYSNPKKFFSHRYSMKNELKDCGRQISLVGYKK